MNQGIIIGLCHLGGVMDLPARRDVFHSHLTENFPKVYNYLRRLVRQPQIAEDLTQEAFLKAWQAFERFDPQKPFLPWILQIGRRTALDYFRRHREFTQPDKLDLQTDPGISPEQQMLNDETNRRLETALMQLPEAERSALFLYYKEELSVAELAGVIHRSNAGVVSLLHRARQALKKILAPDA